MKIVIFDVDGVLLSEESYFDVSSLTIWEFFFGARFLNLPGEYTDFIPEQINPGLVSSIRMRIWDDDRLLVYLKEKGLNSNWDMVHAYMITVLRLMNDVYKARSGGDWLDIDFSSIQALIKTRENVYGLPFPKTKDILAYWKEALPSSQTAFAWMHALAEEVKKSFDGAEWADFGSVLWKINAENFQSWYLGDDLFIETTRRVPYSGGKKGCMDEKRALEDPAAISDLFHALKDRGYTIGIATGRSRKAFEIPFNRFGWLPVFDPLHIVTGTDVCAAQEETGVRNLGKPGPFSILCSSYGNRVEAYAGYVSEDNKIRHGDTVYVVGDSLADLEAARAAGAQFIGIASGALKAASKELFQHEQVPFVEKVTEIVRMIP